MVTVRYVSFFFNVWGGERKYTLVSLGLEGRGLNCSAMIAFGIT